MTKRIPAMARRTALARVSYSVRHVRLPACVELSQEGERTASQERAPDVPSGCKAGATFGVLIFDTRDRVRFRI